MLPHPNIESTLSLSRGATVRRDFANVVSAIVHPLLFPIVTLAVVSYNISHSLTRTGEIVLLTLVVGTLPVAALVWVQVKRGVWTDFDVSQRNQRYTLYPFALACLGLVMYLYLRIGALYAFGCSLALMIANIINGLINTIWKISAHATTAALCATLLWHFTPVWGPPAAASALLVGWSRVELRRHTAGQVFAGWLVGVSSAVLAVYR